MTMFNKITIVGVGLIGGSIGLAARKKKLAKEIIGVCRRESSRRKALKFRAVDKATFNLKEAVSDADLVIIATPVGKIIDLAESCVNFMKKGAILADVGSTKEETVRNIGNFTNKKVNFIGTHPMAGSDKSGVENASSDIFNNAIVIMTKAKNTNKKSLVILANFWRILGCRILLLSPEKHDKHVSLASYLPHAVSFALAASQTKNSLGLAAGSLKDTTRVASSNPELWSDIFLSTRTQTLSAISIFLRNLKELEKALKKKDKEAVKRFLYRAKRLRKQIEK